MKKYITASVSLLMACAIALPAFCGCAPQEPNVQEATASTVSYRSDGNYTTTVTFGDGGLSDVQADDVQVTYEIFRDDDYNAANNIQTSTASDDELAELSSSVSMSQFYDLAYAEVKDVSVRNDGVITVSFVDSNAATNGTDSYNVYIKSKNILAEVPVDFKEHTITAKADGEDYVLVSEDTQTVRVTLVLDAGSEFVTPFPSDALSLRGSFRGMTVADIEAHGRNLSMQLSGGLATDEYSSAYLDGIIDIAALGIKDARSAATVRIPTKVENVAFVARELEVADNKATVPLEAVGSASEDLTKDDIVFEAESGVTVEGLRRKSGVTTLTLNVGAVADKNAAAAKLNGKTVTVKGYEISANFDPASFYPVFEYVEQSGANLRFTLDLYVRCGTFAQTLSEGSFAFGGGFEGATFVSVNRKNDTVAELVIDVPAGSNTTEELDLDGTVVVKAGALVNSWGQASGSDVEHTRNYSQDSMGRDLSDKDITAIKNIVGGFGNTPTGTIIDVASGAASVASGIYTVLDFMGVIESTQTQTLNTVKEISSKLKSINDTLNRQYETIKQIQQKQFTDSLNSFDSTLTTLSDLCDRIEGFMRNGANSKVSGLSLPALPANNDSTTVATEAQCKAYAKALVDGIEELENQQNSTFKGFTSACGQLITAYENVVKKAIKSVGSGANPMTEYDTYCTLVCNFDTQTYNMRDAYRANLQYNIERAFGDLVIWYEGDFDNSDLKKCRDQLNSFEKLLTKDSKRDGYTGDFIVQRRTDIHAHSYVMNLDFSCTAYTDDNLDADTYHWLPRYDISTAISHVEFSGTKGTIKYDSDFQEDQRNDFVSRMSGRTLKQEMTAAGFNKRNDFHVLQEWGVGMAFYRWKSNDGGIDLGDFRRYYHRYAYYIPWDGTEMEKVTTYREYNDEDKTCVNNWYTPDKYV